MQGSNEVQMQQNSLNITITDSIKSVTLKFILTHNSFTYYAQKKVLTVKQRYKTHFLIILRQKTNRS